jgi:hypothetical protein
MMLFTQLRPPLLIAIPFSLVKKNLQATFFVDKKGRFLLDVQYVFLSTGRFFQTSAKARIGSFPGE